MIPRRQFIGAAVLALLAAGCRTIMEEVDLSAAYGLIGQMSAKPGKRDELIGYLLAGTDNMPGSLAYMINQDAADPDAIWIVEVWIDKAAHTASLQLPGVQAAIAKARPILAGFGMRAEVIPVTPLR